MTGKKRDGKLKDGRKKDATMRSEEKSKIGLIIKTLV
jgi:hypothetical protein